MRHNKGETLIFTTGAYSDYGYHGPFMVLRDFNTPSEYDTFLAEWKAERASDPDETWTWMEPSPTDFIAWLAKTCVIEDVEIFSHEHIGNYGEVRIRE